MEGIINWSPGVTLEAIEKQVILVAFRHFRGNKTATASALGISVRTLDNKLIQYEAEGKADKDRAFNERERQANFLARSRGNIISGPDGDALGPVGSITTGQTGAAQPPKTGQRMGDDSKAGIRMESAAQPAAKSPVPMPERKEIQGVLPGKVAAGGSKSPR